MRLAGKVAIITGAASGNGREIALHFAQEGADLVLPDAYFNGADGLCSLLQVYGRRCFATQTDVSVKAEVDAMALAPYDIRVNAVATGLTDTSMTPLLGDFHRRVIEERAPMERYAHPADVAAVAAFLASGDAASFTGEVIPVDAGLTAGFYHAPTARSAVTATMEKLAAGVVEEGTEGTGGRSRF